MFWENDLNKWVVRLSNSMQTFQNTLTNESAKTFSNSKMKQKYAQMDEELKDYVYYGGDSGRHLNYLKQLQQTQPEFALPQHSTHCYCHVEIAKQCYLYNEETKECVVVGSCCVKRFEKKRLCRTCRNPHSGTKYNQCLPCRKIEEKRTKQE